MQLETAQGIVRHPDPTHSAHMRIVKMQLETAQGIVRHPDPTHSKETVLQACEIVMAQTRGCNPDWQIAYQLKKVTK